MLGTDLPVVSVRWQDEIASLLCSFYPSVAALDVAGMSSKQIYPFCLSF